MIKRYPGALVLVVKAGRVEIQVEASFNEGRYGFPSSSGVSLRLTLLRHAK